MKQLQLMFLHSTDIYNFHIFIILFFLEVTKDTSLTSELGTSLALQTVHMRECKAYLSSLDVLATVRGGTSGCRTSRPFGAPNLKKPRIIFQHYTLF